VLCDRFTSKPERQDGLEDATGGAVARAIRVLAVLFLMPAMFSAAGCTSMGLEHRALRDGMDFGPPEQVRMCVYLDDGITQQDATRLLDSWNDEASIYNLYIQPVSFEPLERDGFFHWQIMNQVRSIPLSPSCDRVMYFVNRDLGDMLWGLASLAVPLPEVLGEVDDDTLTHGFVFARTATPAQLVMTPSGVTRHELFHMFGCARHFDMPDCYRRIQSLKAEEVKLDSQGYYERVGESNFYPTFASPGDSMLLSRAQVNGYPEEENTYLSAAAR
jgi:hypothetical protein